MASIKEKLLKTYNLIKNNLSQRSLYPIRQANNFVTQNPTPMGFLRRAITPQIQQGFNQLGQNVNTAIRGPISPLPNQGFQKITQPVRQFAGNMAQDFIQKIPSKTGSMVRMSPPAQLGQYARGFTNGYKPPEWQQQLGQAGNAVVGALDIGTLPFGGGVVKNVAGQLGRQGFKAAVREGAVSGAKFGGLYGGLESLFNEKDQKDVRQYIENIAKNTAMGTAVGGVAGGVLGAAGYAGGKVMGKIRQLTNRPAYVENQLRDLSGKWVEGTTPTKPKGMPKAQWEFQLKFNKKYGRNPYEPVYPDDLNKAFKIEAEKRVGLQVRDINKDKIPGRVAEDRLYDPKLLEKAKKYKNPQEFEDLSFDEVLYDLRKIKQDQVVTIPTKDVEIIWKDDYKNALETAKKTYNPNTAPPVDFIYDIKTGKYKLDDGHNRYVSAVRNNQPIKGEITKIEGNTNELSDLYKKEKGISIKDLWKKAQPKASGVGGEVAQPPLDVVPKGARSGAIDLGAKIELPWTKKQPKVEDVSQSSKPIISQGVKPPVIEPVNASKTAGNPPGGTNVPPEADPVQKVINALQGAKRLEGQQAKIYSDIRSKQAGAIAGVGKNIPGEAGFKAQLSKLKGGMPKVEFESIRKELDQPTIDSLFNRIEDSTLSPFEKITAKSGLSKLLGAEGGSVPVKSELKLLNDIFPPEFMKAVQDKRPLLQRLLNTASDVLNVPRSLMAGVGDFSATLRQNVLLAWRHPVKTAKNFGESVKFFANDSVYKASQKEIATRPNYKYMKDSGLSLTDTGPLMTGREEMFMSNLAEKIPGIGKIVKATGRAYTGFINKMRADVFDDMAGNAKLAGKSLKENPQLAKDISNFINNATGRGGLGPLERSATVLNGALFSPRLLASRINMLNPATYLNPKTDPMVRKEALRTMLSFIGGTLAVEGLASLNDNVQVSTDPRNADFLKMRIGNTRFDPWGGFQQPVVLMARLITNTYVSSITGKEATLGDPTKYKPTTRLDLAVHFLESKESPVASFAIGMMKGVDYLGDKFDPTIEAVKRMIPMVASDGYELYKEHGPVGVLAVFPAIMGVGVQTYGTQVPNVETTPSGKATIKLKPVPGLAENIVNKLRGASISNIPENQQQVIAKSMQQEYQNKVNLDRLKDQVKEDKKVTGDATPATYTIDGEDVSGYKLGDNFVYTNEDGEVKNTTIKKIEKANLQDEKGIIDSNYSLISDRLKRNKNYKDWLQTTQMYVQYLRDYSKKLDPKKDAKEIITIQNKIEDLIYAAQKKTGFGGKGKKLISDAQLISAYKKALEAASIPSGQRTTKVKSIAGALKPVSLKRHKVKSLR